jgi:D-alanyl-D-alanine carboxypeptidase
MHKMDQAHGILFGDFRRIRLLVFLAVLVPAMVLSARCPAYSEESRADPGVQSRLEKAVQEHALPGAVFAVAPGDSKPEIYAAGKADLKTNASMKKDMSFRIGSVTKTFTATAILMLADRGEISLSDTVDSILPQKNVPNGDVITIGNLLSMRSGLSDYTSSEAFQKRRKRAPEHEWGFRELVDFVHVEYAPNRHFAYRNINYIILGEILEKVSGTSRAEFVSRNICKPLGLEHTSVREQATMPPSSARGYLFSNGEAWDVTQRYDPSWGGAAGDMVSNGRDLAVWLRALDRGTLLSDASHSRMLAMRGGFIHGVLAGYGKGVMTLNGAVGHGGDYGGFYTSAVFKYQDTYMVALVNGQKEEDSGDATDLFFALAHSVSPPEEHPEWLGKQLDLLLTLAREGLEVPGVVAKVAFPDNSTWSRAVGVAQAEDPRVSHPADWTGRPMREDLHFRIASVTKSVTATAVLQLCQRDQLSLEDTLGKWLPKLDVATKDRVTIRQLLNHTSGIPDFMSNIEFVNTNYADPVRDWSLKERVGFARPLREPPASYRYSNTNYLLLSRIIEEASGKSYAEYVRHNILNPLEMDSTSVPGIQEYTLPTPYAHGYTFTFNPAKSRPKAMPSRGWLKDQSVGNWQGPGYGNIISTSADLMTWLQALSRGSLLSEESENLMHEYVETDIEGVRYGLGIESNQGYTGHDGDLPGYHAAAYSIEGHDFVVCINGDSLMLRDLFGRPGGGVSGILAVKSIGSLLGL